MSPHDRYYHDPLFKQVVDALYAAIEQAKLTPTEIREAAMVAQIRFENRHPRRMFAIPEGWIRWEHDYDSDRRRDGQQRASIAPREDGVHRPEDPSGIR